jgi:hypothetical protein
MGWYRTFWRLLWCLERYEGGLTRAAESLQTLVGIDQWGERLCNRWQTSTGEWCRLAPDDIVALRMLKATETETAR